MTRWPHARVDFHQEDNMKSSLLHGMGRRDFLELAGAATLLSTSGFAAQALAQVPGTRLVKDMSGVEVTIPDTVTKYCEDWFAHNEFDIMLNKAEGMVMTNCSQANFPWMYYVCPNMKKAIFSEGEDPNFSTLVESGAQIVFSQTNAIRAKCEEVGIPMIDVMFHTFDEMMQSVSLTAQVFGGDAIQIGQMYNQELSQTLNDVRSKTENLPDKPRVLTGSSVYNFDLDGTGTIIQAWIEACGGIQVVTGRTTGNTQAEYSLEQIIAWNPQVIITDDPDGPEKILNDPAWSSIEAVQTKRVYCNPSGVFFWNRYGIEELLQLKWASKLFHPEVFRDVNIDQAVYDFYKKFLSFELSQQDIANILAAHAPDGTKRTSFSMAE